MGTQQQMQGGTAMQGQLWGARARDWAEIQEGPRGWGIPLYQRVLEGTGAGPGTTVLDVGCGAGRFGRLAADRGAAVAGIDAAEALVEIARERTPEGDFRVGDMEHLPWDDDSFDLVTGFSAFQFATNPVGALRDAGRVAGPGGRVVAAVPGRPQETEMAPFLQALRPLLPPPPPGAPEGGPFALSEPGAVEGLLVEAGLTPKGSEEVDCPMEFPDEDSLLRGMLSPGPSVLAIRTSGEEAVRAAALESLAPFRSASGSYRLENRFRYVVATT